MTADPPAPTGRRESVWTAPEPAALRVLGACSLIFCLWSSNEVLGYWPAVVVSVVLGGWAVACLLIGLMRGRRPMSWTFVPVGLRIATVGAVVATAVFVVGWLQTHTFAMAFLGATAPLYVARWWAQRY
ncbi:hypothetical protein [Nakamurella endophytica]|uniref:DUF2568 domain-containing protein n=1 Tax=Nakamurella endophytica TaxID=1748367 RepID=A0A917TCV7_9ACTN|nr:hypothetical protein [Nakamurella endophytica]GGM18838.1 hypothetical protein GCM10011594_43640 [Nakamurella endophytica]